MNCLYCQLTSIFRQIAPARPLILCGALVLLALALAPTHTALAHGGGTPRLTGAQAGPYAVYAWTQPEPPRAGEVHLTVSVTVPATGTASKRQVETAITDADVTVTYTAQDGQEAPVQVQATAQETLGTVSYEADAVLPSSGRWQVEIQVNGREGDGAAAFEIDAAPARRLNMGTLAAGVTVFAGLLFAIALRSITGRGRASSPDRRRDRAARPPIKSANSL